MDVVGDRNVLLVLPHRKSRLDHIPVAQKSSRVEALTTQGRMRRLAVRAGWLMDLNVGHDDGICSE